MKRQSKELVRGLAVFGGIAGGGWLLSRVIKSMIDEPTLEEEVESIETTWVDPKAVKDSASMRKSKMPLQTLIAPLALPLRKHTPHGAFGARRPTNTNKPFDHKHQGVDLAATSFEDIFAVGDGKIVPSNPGKGQLVRVLLLNDGRAVVYADLGSASVEPGKVVKAGDVVGKIMKHNPEKHTGGFVHIAIRESRYGSFLDPTGIIPFNDGKPKPSIV